MKNYRVCFEYPAEDPVHAVIYLVGLTEDPGMRDIVFEWLVTDLDSGTQTKVKASLDQLQHTAADELRRFTEDLKR
jgi:hypothetical protein